MVVDKREEISILPLLTKMLMPYTSFVADLKKLGLSDKEAEVYLAALGLGPNTVQIIARKAKVARATTYLVLEALMDRGLITRYTEDKKTLFVAEDPQQLGRLLERQEEAIKEHKHDLERLLPGLQAYMKTTDDRPVVRYYAGIEGLKAIRSELSMKSHPKDIWRQLAPVDYMKKVLPLEEASYEKQRSVKAIHSRAIISTKSEQLRKELIEGTNKLTERKIVDSNKYGSSSGITILNDKIAIGIWEGKIGGVVIESDSVAHMMKELFDLVWDSIDSKQKKQ